MAGPWRGGEAMDFRLLAIGLATSLATLAGGALALRARGWLDQLVSFGAGALVAVALLDLLPEALTLRGDSSPFALAALTVAGFMAYLALNGLIERRDAARGTVWRHVGPGFLVLHSLLDGFGIGAAFQASASSGLIVGAAVLAHDLLDGANTVTLGLSASLTTRGARRWLVLDALAPLAGLALAQAVRLPPAGLARLLAFFAGSFLYIGAVDLLPRSRTAAPWAALLTIAGAGLVAGVIWLAGG